MLEAGKIIFGSIAAFQPSKTTLQTAGLILGTSWCGSVFVRIVAAARSTVYP
jgi:hypothetical protein